jgi:hypothetical protein
MSPGMRRGSEWGRGRDCGGAAEAMAMELKARKGMRHPSAGASGREKEHCCPQRRHCTQTWLYLPEMEI